MSAPRSILFLHPSAELYGADQALLALVRGLDPAEWRAVVALPHEGPLAERLRATGAVVEIGPLGLGARGTLSLRGLLALGLELPRAVRFTRRLVRRHRPALVHTNTLVVLGGAIGAALSRVPHLWHVHEILERPRWLVRAFHRLLPRLADRVVFVSRAAARAFGLAAHPRARVIHDALCPWQATRPDRRRDELRAELGVTDERVLALLPGRINAWKGQRLLVEAAALLRERCPELSYVLAGDAPPGQERYLVELEEAIDAAGVRDLVRRVPFRTAVSELYAAADLVVVSSTAPEPFGLVALEAMATELPVVAAGHGGLAEVVAHGDTGLCFEPGNARSLAGALERLARDAGEARAMGRRGRVRQEALFAPGVQDAAFARARAEISGGAPDLVHVALGKADPERMNGVNQVVHHLASAQRRAGLRVEVWGLTPTPGAPTAERPYGLRLFGRTRSRLRPDPRLVHALEGLRGAPLFHLHGGFLPELAGVARALRARGLRYVFTPHGAYAAGALRKSRLRKRAWLAAFERRLVRGAEAVHLFTESEAEELARVVRPRSVRVLPSGCEPRTAVLPDLTGGRLVLGCLGRLDARTKGLDLLLDGFAAWVGAGADAELRLAGDGPDRSALEDRARRLDIERRVTFAGPVFGARKDAFLDGLHAFVMTSRHEGMPVAALEAAAAGRPLVLTRGTRLADAARAAGAGYCVHTDTPEAVVEAFEHLAADAAAGRLPEMAASARRFARGSTWDSLAERAASELYGLGSPASRAEIQDPALPPPAPVLRCSPGPERPLATPRPS